MLARSRVLLAVALSSLASCSLTACGTAESPSSGSGPAAGASRAPAVEVDAPQPRLAMSYDGGVLVLDAESGKVLLDEKADGFVRLTPAGDGRHVFVAGPGGFTSLDLGAWSDRHGDHGHSRVREPLLGGVRIPATEPGHVVGHDGRTAVFDDGTGVVTWFDDADLADGTPDLETVELPEPHHGVAVVDRHGNLLHTVGTAEERTGVRLATVSGNELAASDDCPGVHGEAFAGDVAVLGCEDGALVVDGRRITKASAPDAYGRMGNLAGHVSSPYVLGDYKVDPDAELERPRRVSVIDTRDASVRLVDVPASYSFRSLARTPDGDGLVLGTDGRLHVVDVARGRVRDSVTVVAPWREPMDWQEPRPLVQVAGDRAYVTEPTTRQVRVVDLTRLEVVDTLSVPQVPVELSAVTG